MDLVEIFGFLSCYIKHIRILLFDRAVTINPSFQSFGRQAKDFQRNYDDVAFTWKWPFPVKRYQPQDYGLSHQYAPGSNPFARQFDDG